MILLFRIISDEDQEFFRDLVIDGSDTFLDFHKTLQENLGYDPSQLASFFITTEMWEKQQEITLIDMMQEPGLETLTMGEVTLGEYISEVNQRMIYVFDFFSERAFFMELYEGNCLVEAYYRTKPYNSWQLLLIGDPLINPSKNA